MLCNGMENKQGLFSKTLLNKAWWMMMTIAIVGQLCIIRYVISHYGSDTLVFLWDVSRLLLGLFIFGCSVVIVSIESVGASIVVMPLAAWLFCGLFGPLLNKLSVATFSSEGVFIFLFTSTICWILVWLYSKLGLEKVDNRKKGKADVRVVKSRVAERMSDIKPKYFTQEECYYQCEMFVNSFWFDFFDSSEKVSVLLSNLKKNLQGSGYQKWREDFYDKVEKDAKEKNRLPQEQRDILKSYQRAKFDHLKQEELKQPAYRRLCEAYEKCFWSDFLNRTEEISVLLKRFEIALQNSGYQKWYEEFYDVVEKQTKERTRPPKELRRNNFQRVKYEVSEDIRVDFNGLSVTPAQFRILLNDAKAISLGVDDLIVFCRKLAEKRPEFRDFLRGKIIRTAEIA